MGCKEKCEEHLFNTKALVEAKECCDEVKKNLFGNGDMGTSQKADEAYQYIKKLEVSKNGYIDWLFRAVISLLLVWIATRVGLK